MSSTFIVQKNKVCHRLTFAKHTLSLGFTLNIIIVKKLVSCLVCVGVVYGCGKGEGIRSFYKHLVFKKLLV